MRAGGWLAAPDVAWLDERYDVAVAGLPEDAANVTIRVEGGSGLLEYRAFGSDRWPNATFDVTDKWGASGTVILTWDNGTEAFQEQVAFRVACSIACLARFLNGAVASAAGNYIAIAAASVVLAFFAVGHGAAVYAKRNNQAPWNESLSFLLRSRITRDPLYKSKADPLSRNPMWLREQQGELAAAARELVSIQVAAKRFYARNWRLARRISGVRKAAEKR
ncbi:MAG: hypothetical protein AAB368_04645, partial [bacterium]